MKNFYMIIKKMSFFPKTDVDALNKERQGKRDDLIFQYLTQDF